MKEKDLNAKRSKVEQRYEALQKQLTETNETIGKIQAEMATLRGEYKVLTELIGDNKGYDEEANQVNVEDRIKDKK